MAYVASNLLFRWEDDQSTSVPFLFISKPCTDVEWDHLSPLFSRFHEMSMGVWHLGNVTNGKNPSGTYRYP